MRPTTIVLVGLGDDAFAMMQRVCSEPGILTAQTEDADAAMHYIEKHHPEVVVVPRNLERDVLSWIAQVRHVVSDALVIVVGDEEDLTVLDAGADIVLAAPLQEPALAGALRFICPPETAPRLSLLVIEPDPHLASVMLRWLGRAFDVSLVTTGWRAIEVIRDELPDAVLSELRLPDMDASELYASIERTMPDLAERTLFMTAGFVADKAQQFLARIPGQSIYKPFDLKRLRSVLDALFD